MSACRVAGWWLVFALVVGVFGLLGGVRAQSPPAEPRKLDEALPPPRALKGEGQAPSLVPSILDDRVKPIDLPTALRLAGVQNPEILLARERVVEAMAIRQFAAAQFLPSLNLGTNLDMHDGVLQQSNGNILRVARDSLYVGLGANAVAAGSVNIPGLFYNVNVSDVWYEALATRQRVRQQRFASQAVYNDRLLDVAEAYLELLRAEGKRAIAVKNRDEAREVARITGQYARTGEGRQADADRAATELEQRNTDFLQAESDVLTASARLCELLSLDPSIRLHAMDGWVVPAPIVPDPIPLPELIAIALTQRPELGERRAAIQAALLELQRAKCLPFSPNIILGYSTGVFGGGSNLVANGILQPDGTILQKPRFGSFAGRQDFDAVMFWTARNLGIGNCALVRLERSHVRSEDLRQVQVLDRVRSEVAAAYARTFARFAQIGSGERAVDYGQRAFQEDLRRTFNRRGLPIEVIDSLRLLARGRYLYLDAIVDYNRAQFELYVALGRPPADYLARPIPADLVPPPNAACPILPANGTVNDEGAKGHEREE